MASRGPQNRLSFYAIAEGFLSQCLGGRQEPIGQDFAGSSVQVKEGAQHVPGLQSALTAMQPSPAARVTIPKPPGREQSK